MSKEWNKEERWALAMKLDGIIGADIDPDEVDALLDAIRIISPEYAQMLDDMEQEAVEWYENTTDEEKDQQIKEFMREMGIEPLPEGVIDFREKAFIIDIEKHKAGELTLEDMKKKWGYHPKD